MAAREKTNRKSLTNEDECDDSNVFIRKSDDVLLSSFTGQAYSHIVAFFFFDTWNAPLYQQLFIAEKRISFHVSRKGGVKISVYRFEWRSSCHRTRILFFLYFVID
jgi:hypothetical protein